MLQQHPLNQFKQTEFEKKTLAPSEVVLELSRMRNF